MNPQPDATPNTTSRSWRGRREHPQPAEKDFLPAALALQSRPPSPVGRLLAMELVALLVIVIVWLLVSKVDIHAVAAGELVPLGRSKWILAPQLGLVRRILVEEGEVVAQGQPLLALDAAAERFRRQQIDGEILELEQQSARLRALRSATEDARFASRSAAPPAELSAQERQLFHEALASLHAQYDVLLLKLRQQHETHQTEQLALDGMLLRQPLLTRHSDSLHKLFDQRMVPEQEYLRAKLDAVAIMSEVAVAENRLRTQQARIAETRRAAESLIAETRKNWLERLSAARLRLEQLRIERDRLDGRIADLLLRAPTAGTVQELQVHAPDAVVEAAQPLLKLVPQARRFEVNARLANKDIGFVESGQRVKIKVDAFPYTRFGFLEGVVSVISADSAAGRDRVPEYQLKIRLPDASLENYSRVDALTPGMRVSAEIRTGERRLIEFFLAPILRYHSESLRER